METYTLPQRKKLTLFFIILLLFLVLVPLNTIGLIGVEAVNSSSAGRASDLLNELGDFEVLGTVFDFDSRIRTTIAVDPYPIVVYPYQVETYAPYYGSVRAHGIKYMTYGALQFVETNYAEFVSYYNVTPGNFEDKITGVNLEGEYYRYSEPDVNGWPTMGFISRSLWREVLFNVTKLAVEAGADMIVFDGGWGSYSGALTGQSGNPGWYVFDDELVTGFNQYLSSKYTPEELAEKFNITDINNFNFRQYLYDKGYRSKTIDESRRTSIDRVRWEFLPEKDEWGYEIPLPDNYTMNLWREYENYQLKILLDFYDRLSSELKSYAQSKGRNFWIAANLAPTLGTHPPEARLSIIPFLAHIDFPFFEVWYDDIGYPKRNVAPLFRTIYATGKHFASMTCPTPSFSSYFESHSDENPYPEEQVIATAELIATGGWPQLTIGHNITYIRFIQQHPELLPKQQDGEVALVYSLPSAQNYRRRDSGSYYDYWGYLPYESVFYLLSDMNNITFDIVIFGDKELYPYTPTLEELSKYKALILPNTTCLSDEQITLLLNYVNQGGVLIGIGKIGICDENGFNVTAERLEFTSYFNATGDYSDPNSMRIYDYGSGKIVSLTPLVLDEFIRKHKALMEVGEIWHSPYYSPEERAAEWWYYYYSYDVGDWIDWFTSALEQAGVQTSISTDLNPMVMHIRYWDPYNNATLFHFINYLYDNWYNETAVDQVNANFTFELRPELQGKSLRITYYTPEYPDGKELSYSAEPDGRIKVTIPYLHIWGILKVEEDKGEPSTYTIEEPTVWTGTQVLDGDLVVNSSLTLRDAVVKVSSVLGDPVKIEVLSGGSLNIVNSVIEPYDSGSKYYIIVREGGSLRVENSTIRGVGLWGPLDYGGVWVESEDTVVLNSRFENCYHYCLFLMEANCTYIRDTEFTGSTEGIMMYWTWLVKVVNSTFSGNSIGLYTKHVHHLNVVSSVFEGNTEFGAVIDRSEFITFRNSTFTGSEWDGLSFWTSIFVEADDCTAENNGYGFTFRNTPISTVLNSDVFNNTYSGILLRDVNDWNVMPPQPIMAAYPFPTSESLSREEWLPSNVWGSWDGKRSLILFNRIEGNDEGISISCSGYFNENVYVINNTIRSNKVGINVTDTSNSIVAGNNFISNTYHVAATNINIDFNTTNYGNYWDDYSGSGYYEVFDSVYDYQPLAMPNTIEDVDDSNPPNVKIVDWWWEDGWDEDGYNDFISITIQIWDDSPLYVEPQYEIGIVNLLYPAMLTLEEGGSPVMSYAIGPPETSEQPNNVTIDFSSDYYAYWIPNYLNESTLQDASFDVYASDIYGHWSRNESIAPHISLVKSNVSETATLYVEVAVFDQSSIEQVTLHYSTDGVNYQSTPMTYDPEDDTYKGIVQSLPPGKVWFYVSATDIYGYSGETQVYTYEIEVAATVTVSVGASWDEVSEELSLTATAICSVCGEITAGTVNYEILTSEGTSTGIVGEMIYNATSSRWEATVNTRELPLGEYVARVTVVDEAGHSGEDQVTFTIEDTLGSVTSDTSVTPTVASVSITVTANITDFNRRSDVVAAEVFIDSIGADGSGHPLNPVDGSFDSPSEIVEGVVDVSGLSEGLHTVYVHGKDFQGNWGPFDTQTFTVDKTAPSISNIQVTPSIGSPGANFTITVAVTDASDIQFVKAYIQSPDEVDIVVIELFDDGAHSDRGAGDGVYGNTWNSSGSDVGTYYIDIEVADIAGNDKEYENVATFKLACGVETATGVGTAYFETDSGVIVELEPVDESALPSEGKPDLEFPYGFFTFRIEVLTPGQTVTVVIILPSNTPVGTQYWKYQVPEGWYQIPVDDDDGDNIIIIQLTDGGLGDDDGEANGVIEDVGGPGISKALAPAIVGGKLIVSEAEVNTLPYILAIVIALVVTISAYVAFLKRHFT